MSIISRLAIASKNYQKAVEAVGLEPDPANPQRFATSRLMKAREQLHEAVIDYLLEDMRIEDKAILAWIERQAEKRGYL